MSKDVNRSAGYIAAQKVIKKKQTMKEMGEMAKSMGLKRVD